MIFLCCILLLFFPDLGEAGCNNRHFKPNQKDVFIFKTKTETGMKNHVLQNGSFYNMKATLTLENWDDCLFQLSVQIDDANEKNIDFPDLLYELDTRGIGRYFYLEKTLFTMENGLATEIFSTKKMEETENQDLVNFRRGLIGLFQLQTGTNGGKTLKEDDVTGRCNVLYKEENDKSGRTIVSKERNLNDCEFRSSSKSNIFVSGKTPMFDSKSRCKYVLSKSDSKLDSIECDEFHFLLPFSNAERTEGRYVQTKIEVTRESSSTVTSSKPFGIFTTPIFYDFAKFKPTRNLYQLSFQALRRVNKLLRDGYVQESHTDSAKVFYEVVEILRVLGKKEIDQIFEGPKDDRKKRIIGDLLSSCGTVVCVNKFIEVFKTTQSSWNYQLPAHAMSSLAFNADPGTTLYTIRKNQDPSGLLTMTTLLSRACAQNLSCRKGQRVSSTFISALKRPIRKIYSAVRRYKKTNKDFTENEYKNFITVMKSLKNINFVLKNRRAKRTLTYLLEIISSRFLRLSVAAIDSLEGIKMSKVHQTMSKIFKDSKENFQKRFSAFRVLAHKPDDTIIKNAINKVNDENEDIQLRLFLYSFLKTKAKLENKYSKILETNSLNEVKHTETKSSYYMVSTISSNHLEGTVTEWAVYEKKKSQVMLSKSSYAFQVNIFGEKIDLFEITTETISETGNRLAFIKLFGHNIDVLSSEDLINNGGGIFNLEDPISTMTKIFKGFFKTMKKQMVVFEGYHSIPTILGSRITVDANITADITMDVQGKLNFPSLIQSVTGKSSEIDATVHPSATILSSNQLTISAPKLSKIGTKIDTAMYFSKKLSGKYSHKGGKIDMTYNVDKDRDLIAQFRTVITNIMQRKTSEMFIEGTQEKTCTNDEWKSSELIGLNMCIKSRYAFPKKSLSYNLLASPILVNMYATLDDSNIKSYRYEADFTKSNKVRYSAVGSVPEKYHEAEVNINLERDEEKNIVKTSASVKTSDAKPKSKGIITSQSVVYGKLDSTSISVNRMLQYKDLKLADNWSLTLTQKCFTYNYNVTYGNGNDYKEHIMYNPPYINLKLAQKKGGTRYFFRSKPISDNNDDTKCDVASSGKMPSQSFLENIANILEWTMKN